MQRYRHLKFFQHGGGRHLKSVRLVTTYECRKGLCSRSQCRLTGHCTVMPLSTCGSLHQSPTSRPDKDFSLPPRTICAFLPSNCLLLDVVLSLSLALVFGTIFLRRHFSTLSVHFPKAFKTASFSTLLSWPCPLS